MDDRNLRRKQYAWSIAVEVTSKTGEDAVTIYNKLMKIFEEKDDKARRSLCESNETKAS